MKKLAKNFLYLFLSDAVSHLLGFIATVYIARILGIAGFGKISYGLTFLTYALLFGNLGLTTIGAREVAKNGNNLKIISEILGLRFFLALIIFTCLIAGILIIPGDELSKKIIFFYSLTLFPFAVLLEFVFQGREEMEYIGLGRLIQYSVYVGLLFLLIKNKEKILLIPFAYFISYLVVSVFMMIVFLNKYQEVRLRFNLRAFSVLIITALPVGLATLTYQMAMNFAPLILGIFHHDVDVGYFSAGYKIVVFMLILERVAYYLFFPVLSRKSAETPHKLPETFVAFTQLLLLITVPITIIVLIIAPILIRVIYGAGYEPSVGIFRLLSLYFMIAPINTIWGYGLVALHQEREFFKVIGIISIINFILTSILGITFKGIGVGLAIFLSEVAGLFLMKSYLGRYVKFNIGQKINRAVLREILILKEPSQR
ncbi:MAG: flippase [candidate division WOR-3 bacterium]